MSDKKQPFDIHDLEEKLDILIQQYELIKNENISLKAKQTILVKEKAKLIEKTHLARTRVEAMISRLKNMEQDS